jgi:hypothetical protein
LLRLPLSRFRYDSRFSQGVPQELQHRIVLSSKVQLDDLLSSQADRSAELVMGPQKSIHRKTTWGRIAEILTRIIQSDWVASGRGGISAAGLPLGFASAGEAACESPVLGDSSRASSNVLLTSRQNFLVRSSFIGSLVAVLRVPAGGQAMRAQVRRFLLRS